MSRPPIRSIAVVAVIASLALGGTSGVAAAAGKSQSQTHSAKVVKKKKQRTTALRTAGGATTLPPISTTTAVAISAFPTGGKGTGTEATCELWTDQLQADVRELDRAEPGDRVEASNNLQGHIDDALDAGCAVIY